MKRYQFITLVFIVWAVLVTAKLSHRFQHHVAYVLEELYESESTADSLAAPRPTPKPQADKGKAKVKPEPKPPASRSIDLSTFRTFY